MSGRITTADLEQQFTQIVRLATSLGADTDDWQLIPGSVDEDSEREPWVISDGSPHPLVRLGYTRRDALTSLAAQAAILRAVVE